jgi:hypothetical protein
MLTFHPRRALLEAAAAGQAFRVPVYRDQTRILAWEKVQELRPGKVTLWDHAFELPGGELDRGASVIRRVAVGPGALEAYDFPGAHAQRFDGVDTGGDAFHSHAGVALYVGTRSSGIHIHGLPVCNRRTCIIVLQHWDDLRRAIAAEKRLSFSVSS